MILLAIIMYCGVEDITGKISQIFTNALNQVYNLAIQRDAMVGSAAYKYSVAEEFQLKTRSPI